MPVLFKLCSVALAWNKKCGIGNCCFCIFVSRFYFLGNRNLLIHALESWIVLISVVTYFCFDRTGLFYWFLEYLFSKCSRDQGCNFECKIGGQAFGFFVCTKDWFEIIDLKDFHSLSWRPCGSFYICWSLHLLPL